jgi:putative alpha-1,2-mannosidase
MPQKRKILKLRSIWDLFRSQTPFLTVLDPNTVAKMVRSLIDTCKSINLLYSYT